MIVQRLYKTLAHVKNKEMYTGVRIYQHNRISMFLSILNMYVDVYLN